MLRHALVTALLLTACGKTDAAPAPTPAPAPAAAPAAEPLKVGDPAPDVTFTLHDGKSVSLASLKGGRVLVYFYPKDDTAGCTIEAQQFRDRNDDLVAAGITVFGVSLQDAASHQAFIDKNKLPFPLVVDADQSVVKAFHVPLIKPNIAKRQSFLVGKDGKLEAVWLDVDPSKHAEEVLAVLVK